MKFASAPREQSSGDNGVFVGGVDATRAELRRIIQSGERREAPRKDTAIREHETPGANAFRVRGSRVSFRRAAFGSPLAGLRPFAL